jgi:3-oxoacyl-[acyl-carrier-protein] synthase II
VREIRDDDAAITGLGLVTPLGFGVDDVVAALAAGRDAGTTVGNDGDPDGTRIAALVAEPWLREPIPEEHAAQAKFLTASGQMAVTAVREALRQAALPERPTPDPRRGLFLAQMDWMSIEYADFRPVFLDATDGYTKPWTAEGLNTATLRKLNPFYLLDTLNNNAYSFVTALLGWMGPGTSLSGPAGPGLLGVSMAARAIRRGDADAMLAVGAGRWTLPIARLELARRNAALSEKDRRIPGEGAAAVVLEPLGLARARGAQPLAVVLGWGAGFGPADDVTSVESAITAALEDAGVELRAIGVLFVPFAACARAHDAHRIVPVYLSRRRLGDLGPASDVTDVILAVDMLRRRPGMNPMLVVTRGVDGQATALVLARPS